MLTRKTFFLLLIFAVMIGLLPGIAMAAPPIDERSGQIYVVQADDWLGRLADKFYGDPLVYPLIVEATNTQAAQDISYARISDPSTIQIGQKLLIPPIEGFSEAAVEAAREKATMAENAVATQKGPTQEQRQILASLDVVGQPPELYNEVWLNSEPLKLADLQGKVVIVEFWTFG